MAALGSTPNSAPTTGQWFATTHWSVVLTARDSESPHAAEAMEKLCRTYWYPLYAYARRQGRQHEDAQDLTQAFFADFLEKKYVARADRDRGRFRNFFLTSFKNFLSNEWDRARTARRGGGQKLLSWDAQSAENRYAIEPVEAQAPDKAFEKSWAVATLEQALARLREEYSAAGKGAVYENLKLHLWEEKGAETYAGLGARLGMTEAAIKMAVMRLRQRCREALRTEVAHTVENPSEVNEELRYLLSVLRG
jgi:RNA polymerase sigma factor (sigma-70 family)